MLRRCCVLLALLIAWLPAQQATAPPPPKAPEAPIPGIDEELTTGQIVPKPLVTPGRKAQAPPEPSPNTAPSPDKKEQPAEDADFTPAPESTESSTAEGAPPASSDPRVRTVPRGAKSGVPPILGPVFKVRGAAAVVHARSLGYKFSPAGGVGNRDGLHTKASQFPSVTTSEVDGIQMIQYRPAAGWAISKISNTFYMFVDGNLKPAPLSPGWRIRGLRFNGPNWVWAGQPASGAPTASFALTLVAFKNNLPATVVELESITLEGPKGATDWRQAFTPVLPPDAKK